MGLVSLFATSLAAPAAKSVWTGLALTREKGGPVTARKKPMLCPRDHVSLMIPVPELQTAPMKTPLVPAAIQNMFHHATKRRNARRPSLNLV